jgi:hypothetical protein
MNASELFQNWMPDLTGQLDNIFNYVFKGAVMSSVKKRSVKGGCPLNGLTRPKRHNVPYIMRILGVDQSEEFDYRIVNHVSPIPLIIYIKKIACYP